MPNALVGLPRYGKDSGTSASTQNQRHELNRWIERLGYATKSPIHPAYFTTTLENLKSLHQEYVSWTLSTPFLNPCFWSIKLHATSLYLFCGAGTNFAHRIRLVLTVDAGISLLWEARIRIQHRIGYYNRELVPPYRLHHYIQRREKFLNWV